MDYEKAYKEALKRAKGFKTDEYKDVAEYIFPELIELEDERIRKELLAVINDLVLPDEQQSRFVAWLEKQGEQKPAGWSEEDERKINRIYSILRQAADTHAFSTSCRLIGDKECIELQDFLKSLRPQNRWKPSDEQMKALWEVYKGGEEQAALASLYSDLKKLKD